LAHRSTKVFLCENLLENLSQNKGFSQQNIRSQNNKQTHRRFFLIVGFRNRITRKREKRKEKKTQHRTKTKKTLVQGLIQMENNLRERLSDQQRTMTHIITELTSDLSEVERLE